jgi:hypothetical protein
LDGLLFPEEAEEMRNVPISRECPALLSPSQADKRKKISLAEIAVIAEEEF